MKKSVLSLALLVSVGAVFGAAEQAPVQKSSVVKMNYQNESIGSGNLQSVIDGLGNYARIVPSLTLSGTGITDADVPAIINLLQTNRKIKSLVLGRNGLTDTTAKALANAIGQSSLTEIYIHGNEGITDVGYQYFADMLKDNSNIVIFNGNRGFGGISTPIVEDINTSIALNKDLKTKIAEIKSKLPRNSCGELRQAAYAGRHEDMELLRTLNNEPRTFEQLERAESLIIDYRFSYHPVDVSDFNVDENLVKACLKTNTVDSLKLANHYLDDHGVAFISKNTYRLLKEKIANSLSKIAVQ